MRATVQNHHHHHHNRYPHRSPKNNLFATSSPATLFVVPFPRQIRHSPSPPCLGFATSTATPGMELYGQIQRIVHSSVSSGTIRALRAQGEANLSAWDEKPYEILQNGKKSYLDEQDIVTFLDPPKKLIPLDPSTYNPAVYLWKKIEDIPMERRHRLLHLMTPRLISRAWQIAGRRYVDPKLTKKAEYNLLIEEDGVMSVEFYNCRTSGGPIPISLVKYFKKAIFSRDGETYGRFIGGPILERFANSFSPLYFVVSHLKKVMSTEQPCDLAYEFGDGLLDLREYPQGFPTPVKHPYPFNDQAVLYVRHIGPGVSVGQAWQEGKKLEQVPRKFCGEILMVRDYAQFREDH